MMLDRIDLAVAYGFAAAAHASKGQKRKYDGQPYITHPVRVVGILRNALMTPPMEMLQAALLHDVLEDTDVDPEMIRYHFGVEVLSLVQDLTDKSILSEHKGKSRAERKAIDRHYLSMASADAQTIKLADTIDNTRDIVKYDPQFAKVYLPEKIALLEVLIDGDARLWNIARRQIAEAQEALKAA